MTLLNPEFFWLLLPLLLLFRGSKISLILKGYILTYIFVILAITRVVIPQEPVDVDMVLSDVVIGVDLSYSMQGHDLSPSRLIVAQQHLHHIVESLQESRFGVIGFTTNAILLSPLTQDVELLKQLFSAVNSKLIVTKGSSIMPMLKLATKVSKAKHPTIIILSDGGDELNYSDEANFAKESGLVVNTLMLATKIGSTLKTESGAILKDELGDIVITRENSNIAQLSEATGGIYSKDVDELINSITSQQKKNFKTETTIIKNIELFYYFTVLAIVVFLITLTTLKRYVIAFFLLFGMSLDASIVESYYQYIEPSKMHYNVACKLYKKGEYEKAIVEFSKATSNSKRFKADIFYNIGNSYIRVQEYAKAREFFLKSLTLNYTKEADENMRYIANVAEKQEMTTSQQKTKDRSSMAKQEKSKKSSKDGGSSNMKVSAKSSDGASSRIKKSKQESMLSLNRGDAKLSSKQYELINKRVVDEKKPW